MKKVILKIDGMSCSACSSRIEKYLNHQDGVKAMVNLVMANALIYYDEEKLTISDLEKYIYESGYKSLGIYDEKKEIKPDYSKKLLLVFLVILLLLMYTSMSHMLKLPIVSILDIEKNPVNYGLCLLLLTIPFIIYGADIIKSGIGKLFHKSPNMDSLVTIGIIASFIYSLVNLILVLLGNTNLVHYLYFESIAMIIYFVKLGRVLSDNSKEKTKDAIKDLVTMTPEYALVKVNDEEKKVSIDEIKKGDILICKPGDKIAVDGEIISGKSHFEEAFITGESVPSKKSVGDKVLAGSINIDGYVLYKAFKIGPDSTISEIVRLVLESANSKAPIARIADKISAYFVPCIIGIALITFLIYLIFGYSISEAITRFVTVLVVACPCAIGLATPLAIVASIGYLAKNGILIKNSAILEKVKDVDTVIFDKTGTLTYGNLKVSNIRNFSKYQDDELLSIIASLEHNSNHPIAKAFSTYYVDKKTIIDFQNIDGIGIKGKINNNEYYIGNNKICDLLKIKNNYLKIENELIQNGQSIVYLIENKEILGIVGVSDVLRREANQVIENLQKMHKKVIMLSGDNQVTVEKIGKELKINESIGNMLPQEKCNMLDKLTKQGAKIMMVGDGINDAPSLTKALVGVSINGASNIAVNSASVILMNDDLKKIVELIKMSEKTVKIIKENLFWAFVYNILMIPIATGIFHPFGIALSPMLASIGMTISSLTVLVNSLRLRKGVKENV